jgi:hypothetical protein
MGANIGYNETDPKYKQTFNNPEKYIYTDSDSYGHTVLQIKYPYME